MQENEKNAYTHSSYKILLLGGTGYLGKLVACHLAEQGNKLVLTRRKHSNLDGLDKYKKSVKFIPATTEAVQATMNYENFDLVLNMATNYGRSNVLYDNVIEANIEFPLFIMNLAVEYGVKQFITIGTGLPDELNMYSFSKKIYSEFGRFYSEKHHINFLDMKLEMFYGGG